MFDIQKFTEEQNLEPIPEEFAGLEESTAREMMNKYAKENKPDSEFDEVDDDGNYSGDKDLSRVKIPYERFKQTIDEKNKYESRVNDVEKELAAYRQRYGDLNAQQNYQQPVQNQPEKNSPPQRYFTADDAKQIDDAIKNTAMQWTGFSQEDVDGIDYLDDDDPKIGLWNHAKELAKIATYNQIVANQAAQMQEEQRRNNLMNQSINEFQNYAQQQTQAEEYEALRNFASNEFFNAQSPSDQQIIYEADWRLANGGATPADYKTIRDYFTMAKFAYDAKNSAKNTPAPKIEQKSPKAQFPRTDNLNGVSGSGGGITASSLAEMVRNVPWNKIPDEYKEKILNSTT